MYIELLNFEMEVMNILQTKVYYLNNKEQAPIIMKFLEREGLQLIQPFTNFKKGVCKTTEGLFNI